MWFFEHIGGKASVYKGFVCFCYFTNLTTLPVLTTLLPKMNTLTILNTLKTHKGQTPQGICLYVFISPWDPPAFSSPIQVLTLVRQTLDLDSLYTESAGAHQLPQNPAHR